MPSFASDGDFAHTSSVDAAIFSDTDELSNAILAQLHERIPSDSRLRSIESIQISEVKPERGLPEEESNLPINSLVAGGVLTLSMLGIAGLAISRRNSARARSRENQ